jgi:hypothetical protein
MNPNGGCAPGPFHFPVVPIRVSFAAMGTFLFRCPMRGIKVQGWVADDAKNDEYIPVKCAACGLAHYVNPKTGKWLGEDK